MSGRGKKKISYINVVRKWFVGIYTRRSFDDLDDSESNTIVNQKNMIIEFLNNLPNVTIVEYYVDDGYSGTNFNRPGFQDMMNDIKNGRINTIVVKDLSRLGRNYIELGKYIEEIFPLYNLRIIAINDNIDSHLNPESVNSLMVPIKNLMNENYAQDISKKVSSAYQTMAKKGLFASGTTPYGYTFDPNDKHHLIIDESEAIIVRKIFDMALNGDGKIVICKRLNNEGILCRKELQRRKKYNLSLNAFDDEVKYIWSTSTIGRMLSNETYIGNLVQGKSTMVSYKDKRKIYKDKSEWIIYKDAHEPIISIDDFKKVQELIKDRTVKKKSPKNYSIYNGILKCADCGRAMCKQEDFRGNRNVSNYYCNSYLRETNKCSSHKIKTVDLDNYVLETIQMQIKLVIELERSLKKLNIFDNKTLIEEEFQKNIKLSNLMLEKYKREKKEKYEEWKLGYIEKDEYIKFSDEITSKIKAVNEEIEMYNSTYFEKLKKIRKNDYWINHYKRNKKIKKVTREVLLELVESIKVFENGNIIIEFKYQDQYSSIINYLENREGAKECLNGLLEYI